MQGKKVLFVDDDNFIQATGKALLNALKLNFVVCKGGAEAVQDFTSGAGSFTTLIIDIHMPGKDGYQTCQEIRAIEKSKGYSKSRIVAMSGDNDPKTLAATKAAGFDDFLTKPLKKADLEAKL